MRASLTPVGGGARPARANSRAAGVCSGGASVARPLQEAARVPIADDASAGERDHAIGGGEAALEPVLDEHDGGLPLLVETAQLPDELIAGDGVELGGRLVEQHEPRARRESRAERDALQLPAGELVGGAVEQVCDPERERHLLDAARDGGRLVAEVLERERQLGAHRAHHDLGLGVLQHGAGDRAELGRAMVAGVEPVDEHASGELATVEVRDEAAGRAQERRLARPRQSGDDHELAGLDRRA